MKETKRTSFRTPAPQFTQVPNDFLDDWVHDLSLMESKVMLVIYRKTFGWHKTRDQISISQLEKCTGHGKQAILKAVNGLIKKGAIRKIVEGRKGEQKTYYEVVMEEDSNNSDQCDSHTPPQCDFHTGGSVNFTHTKETSTKERRREDVATDVSEDRKRPIATKLNFSFERREFSGITEQDKDGWRTAYPATDIERELAAMREWLLANPSRRKTNYRLFITRWLAKAQDKGPARTSTEKPQKAKDEFDILIEMYDPASRGYAVIRQFGVVTLQSLSKGYSYKFTDAQSLMSWMKDKSWTTKKERT